MGTSTNEHTGSRMASKPSTDKYRDNWDSIFGKKKEEGHTIDQYPVGFWGVFDVHPETLFPHTKWKVGCVVGKTSETEIKRYLRVE